MKYILILTTLLAALLLAGCAGPDRTRVSPIVLALQTDEEVYKDLYDGKSLTELCRMVSIHNSDNRRNKAGWKKRGWERVTSVIDLSFERYGTTREYCNDPAAYQYNKAWNRQEYNIDGLLIVTEAKRPSPESCDTGNIHRITLTGMIGPDSSYAIEELMKNTTPCSDVSGNILTPVAVQLESGGGLINDGYLLGRTLKKYRATTIIKNDKICASSCAVAFLGGEKRIVEDKGTVLFHAPYYNRLNALGESDPNCEVEDSVLSKMQGYFAEMTTPDISKRLFERTMWYCSADNGWTVTGGNAAKLYGIATE
jgi:ATP-dependent protease ClpP protease subunit